MLPAAFTTSIGSMLINLTKEASSGWPSKDASASFGISQFKALAIKEVDSWLGIN